MLINKHRLSTMRLNEHNTAPAAFAGKGGAGGLRAKAVGGGQPRQGAQLSMQSSCVLDPDQSISLPHLQAEEGPEDCVPKRWAVANPGKAHPNFTDIKNCPGMAAPQLPKQVCWWCSFLADAGAGDGTQVQLAQLCQHHASCLVTL